MDAPAQATPTDPRDLTGPFSHRVTIEVRFADTDAMGHVNNATYLTYCEIARIKYWTDVTGVPIDHRTAGAESLILAEARITYRSPAFYGETVTVETRGDEGRPDVVPPRASADCGDAGRGVAARRRQRFGPRPL